VLSARINAAPGSTMDRHLLPIPRLEANNEFITAQQVRDIRASLRAMDGSGETKTVDEFSQDQHKRVDTEHRGVTGTLVLTDVLDEKVSIPQSRLPRAFSRCKVRRLSVVRKLVPPGTLPNSAVRKSKEDARWQNNPRPPTLRRSRRSSQRTCPFLVPPAPFPHGFTNSFFPCRVLISDSGPGPRNIASCLL
jgi:hypothetical protein